MPKYVIAYPFGGRPVPVDWHIAVRSLITPTNAPTTEIFTRNMKLEDAQNNMAERALEMGAEYILFIEDDTAPPPGTICELGRVLEQADEEVMVCGGIYTTRTPSPEPIVYMGPGQGSYWAWKAGDVFKCFACGMGCTMIRTKIFQMMPKPWFKELRTYEDVLQYPELFPNVKPSTQCGVSTDFFFYSKLKAMGFKAMAHGGVLPVHYDGQTGYWLPKKSYPVKELSFEGKEYGWEVTV